VKFWKEFSAEQPELAEHGKKMLLRSRKHVGLVFIATLRKDGAPLSHAAIAARELGIPAVV